ncbi:DUF1653 domain-containing protein [Halioxenophilus aromaticivorans]|uniref:DUF1653 domain-containing protein n=1 Tax=Halioxenophilus aromaticivorans TaxID=1306992 RepID=A0AAV3TZB0_9ALTE
MASITTGIYRHYKGNLYFVYSVARHSESEQSLVVYRCLYGRYDLWVRPLDMFTGTVDVNGEPVPRFSFVRSVNLEEQTDLLTLTSTPSITQ